MQNNRLFQGPGLSLSLSPGPPQQGRPHPRDLAFPPGKATWPDHLSPARPARLIKSNSGSPALHPVLRKEPLIVRMAVMQVYRPLWTDSLTAAGTGWYAGRTRMMAATLARFWEELGGLGTCG